MNEGMSFYNQLYKTLEIDFNPIMDYKVTESITEVGTSESITNDSSNRNITSTEDLTTDGLGNSRQSDSNSKFSNIDNKIIKEEESTINENDLSKFLEGGQGSISNIDTHMTNATKSEGDNTQDSMSNEHAETTQNDVHTGSSRNDYEVNNVSERSSNVEDGVTKLVDSESTNNKNLNVTKEGKVSVKSYSELLIEYRNTIINIDKLVIQELSDLFYNLY